MINVSGGDSGSGGRLLIIVVIKGDTSRGNEQYWW